MGVVNLPEEFPIAAIAVYEIDSGPGGLSYEWEDRDGHLQNGTLAEAIEFVRAQRANLLLCTVEAYYAADEAGLL